MKTRKQQVTMRMGIKWSLEPWRECKIVKPPWKTANSFDTLKQSYDDLQKWVWHWTALKIHIFISVDWCSSQTSSEKFLSAVDGGWCRNLTGGQRPENKCQENARYTWDICVEFPLHKVQRNHCRRWGRKVARHWGWGGLEQKCIFWSLRN